jgi:serine/threonine protein phosphatase PrpC
MKVRIRWTSDNHAKEKGKLQMNGPATEPGIIEGPMIEASGLSDPGCVRTNNEDYYLVSPSIGLYVVADGMGGAQAGEEASKLAADTVQDILSQAVSKAAGRKVDTATLVSAFEDANRRVMDKAATDASLDGMGTTLVVAIEAGDELLIGSVGDSRAYVFENGSLKTITQDQTWVNEVGRRLGLDEESLKSHPMRHVLTMAIGVSEELRVHTYTLKPAPGTQILLCSDGLHGVASEEDLTSALASSEPLAAKCATLVAAARAKGGPDNITAVLLKAS